MKPNVLQNTNISEIDVDDASTTLNLEKFLLQIKPSCTVTVRNQIWHQSISGNLQGFLIVATKYALSHLPIRNEFPLKRNWLYANVYDYSNVSNVLHITSNLPQVISQVEKPPLREWITACPNFVNLSPDQKCQLTLIGTK